MNEADTRSKKIDPKLHAAGWSEDLIVREYPVAPGRIERIKSHKPKAADYLLCYRHRAVAVVEAKRDDRDVSEGVEQAKYYAERLQIRFTYSTNGDDIYLIDMGVKDRCGNYTVPSTEGPVDHFMSPEEIWQKLYAEENVWRDKFDACPLNRDGGREPRYYQELAIKNVLDAVAREQRRILLTMATGTGKTYTAFEICWKLMQTRWNIHGGDRQPRILFISDRNILANQAVNDFSAFPEDAIERVTPGKLHKADNTVPTSRNLFFSIFQTFMGDDGTGKPFYMQYPVDFFDLIIIDECHRGGANDQSEWRKLMEYFEPAYQLGMTATPRRKVNADTYKYFGESVYSYSLKQGIEDGYLVPFRVKRSTSKIDEYTYCEDDDVEGEIDREKTYTESDFYHGNIEMRQRDEHRVVELLDQIDPDQKTLIFCARQVHAMVVRDLVNQHKKRPDANYCQRVTADDGEEGERTLRIFQNNDKLRPTILTTSSKLSTGVDARNVRNIVLMRPVNNIVEFKQIIGRGTRLFDDKYFFTIYDFVGATKLFADPDWDGDPEMVEESGNATPDGNKDGDDKQPDSHDVTPYEPQVYPLPWEVQESDKHVVKVRLSASRQVELLQTQWEELIQYGNETLTVKAFIEKMFGRLPLFFNGAEDLRERWSHPKTREALLEQLANEGFEADKLERLRHLITFGNGQGMDDCDLLDVLEYVAYETTPMQREKRVALVQESYEKMLEAKWKPFVDVICQYYTHNGYTELATKNMSVFLEKAYKSTADAINTLKCSTDDIKQKYFELQWQLYNGEAVNEYRRKM